MNIASTWHDVDEPSETAQDRALRLKKYLSGLLLIRIKNQVDIETARKELVSISNISKDVNDNDL